jgi:hypothetical protein
LNLWSLLLLTRFGDFLFLGLMEIPDILTPSYRRKLTPSFPE